jgi:hypothetical protein
MSRGPHGLPPRYLPSNNLTPAFRLVLATEAAETSADGVAIQRYRDALLEAAATCFLCKKPTFGSALMPAAYAVIDRPGGGLRVGGICSACVDRDAWLDGRVTDRLARDMRARREEGERGRRLRPQPTSE